MLYLREKHIYHCFTLYVAVVVVEMADVAVDDDNDYDDVNDGDLG